MPEMSQVVLDICVKTGMDRSDRDTRFLISLSEEVWHSGVCAGHSDLLRNSETQMEW